MILLKGSLVIRAQLWDFKNLTGEGGCGGGGRFGDQVPKNWEKSL